jgi:uncharacterized membrane protein required for colicin V production
MQSLLNTPDIMGAFHLNWFDLGVVVWLIVGIFRGRKHGMSQELLPATQWIAVVILTSLLYLPAAQMLVHYTKLTLLPCALFAYVFIGCFIYGLLGKLKKKLDDMFQEGDYFGNGEYYLGMASGVIRFVCILIAMLAVLNCRIVSKAEREATLRMQEKNFEGIRFPTFGEVQNTILFESATGNIVRLYLNQFLIQPVNPGDAPAPKLSTPTRAVAKSTTSTTTTTHGDGGLKITFNH